MFVPQSIEKFFFRVRRRRVALLHDVANGCRFWRDRNLRPISVVLQVFGQSKGMVWFIRVAFGFESAFSCGLSTLFYIGVKKLPYQLCSSISFIFEWTLNSFLDFTLRFLKNCLNLYICENILASIWNRCRKTDEFVDIFLWTLLATALPYVIGPCVFYFITHALCHYIHWSITHYAKSVF